MERTPTSSLLARLNIIDGIFANQIGVRIAAGSITMLTSANQPFTGTTAVDAARPAARLPHRQRHAAGRGAVAPDDRPQPRRSHRRHRLCRQPLQRPLWREPVRGAQQPEFRRADRRARDRPRVRRAARRGVRLGLRGRSARLPDGRGNSAAAATLSACSLGQMRAEAGARAAASRRSMRRMPRSAHR